MASRPPPRTASTRLGTLAVGTNHHTKRITHIAGKQTLADPGKGIVHRTRNALGDIGNRLTKGPGLIRRTATTTRKALTSSGENIGGIGIQKQTKKDGKEVEVTKPMKPEATKVGTEQEQQSKKEDLVEDVKQITKDGVAGGGDADVESLTTAFSQTRLVIDDIDEKDVGELMLKEYAKDVDEYLLSIEQNYTIGEDFLKDRTVNSRMRAVLLDWIVEVHSQFALCQETLYLSQKILDRYLQIDSTISRSQLQLAGVTALLIAVKYEEVFVPTIVDFSSVSDNAFKPSDVRLMEMKMLKALKYDVGSPSPVHFLRRWSKAYRAEFAEYSLAKYIMELSLVDYTLSHVCPSALAAGSLALSLMVLNNKKIQLAWNPTVVHYTRYSLQKLKPTIKLLCMCLVRMYDDTSNNRFQSVINKYSRSKYFRTSKIPQLQLQNWKNRVISEINSL